MRQKTSPMLVLSAVLFGLALAASPLFALLGLKHR
jgi:hypothetical protein